MEEIAVQVAPNKGVAPIAKILKERWSKTNLRLVQTESEKAS